jgi:hypothetical protein
LFTALQDSLPYMEPPYWYYPVRQSLAVAGLRSRRLAENRKSVMAITAASNAPE